MEPSDVGVVLGLQVSLLLDEHELVKKKLQLRQSLVFLKWLVTGSRLKKADLEFLCVFERNEKAVYWFYIIMDFLGPDDCWSWQVLGLCYRLFTQLETTLLSLEEESVIPEGQEEIIIESSVLNTKPLFRDIVNRLMLKIEFVDEKLFFRRGAVFVASESVDLILDFLLLF